MSTRRLLFAAALFAAGCGKSEPAARTDAGWLQPEASDDAGQDSATDAQPAWDPVWHLTEAKQWPSVGPADISPCGPACRNALHHPSMHPAYYGHAYAMSGFADVNTDTDRLFFGPIESDETWILGEADGERAAFVEPYLHGELLSFLAIRPDRGGNVEVMNVRTGERKLAYRYENKPNDCGVALTALSSKYVFWKRVGVGIMSRNLLTGEIRVLTPLQPTCDRLCTTEDAIICSHVGSERVVRIDQETGEATPLDDGGALQSDGSCSPDCKQVIWVDYRDPPGQSSHWFMPRSGGDIYVKNLETGELRRLTHDSPESPRAKTWPAIHGSLAAWKEPRLEHDPNPPSGQTVYAGTWALVVLDLDTGAKCRIESDQVRQFGRLSVHDRQVFAYWGDGTGDRVVGLSVDDPAAGCEPY